MQWRVQPDPPLSGCYYGDASRAKTKAEQKLSSLRQEPLADLWQPNLAWQRKRESHLSLSLSPSVSLICTLKAFIHKQILTWRNKLTDTTNRNERKRINQRLKWMGARVEVWEVPGPEPVIQTGRRAAPIIFSERQEAVSNQKTEMWLLVRLVSVLINSLWDVIIDQKFLHFTTHLGGGIRSSRPLLLWPGILNTRAKNMTKNFGKNISFANIFYILIWRVNAISFLIDF